MRADGEVVSRPKGLPVRHPDTISGLEPDCRRVLRDKYMAIQVAMTRQPERVEVPRMGSGQWSDMIVGYDVQYVRDERAVGRAIAEYRRVAAMWDVDVEVRS